MENTPKTIGILTSGGDAPGMNAAVRAVVRAAMKKGIKVLGVKHGYNGLIRGDVEELTMRSVSGIMQRGGTLLYTARCKRFREWEGVVEAKDTCLRLGIDGLVVIGGDGSFRGAADLSKAAAESNDRLFCVGIPGTIDNDISCTDYTIGYDTAMNTAMEMIDKIRDTAQSHDRCSVIEVMGRRAGYIALNTGIACGATCILVPEVEMTDEQLLKKISTAHSMGKQNFIVLVTEKLRDPFKLAEMIEDETDIETRATILGHVQRGGNPTVRDRVAASEMGYYAVELLSKGVGNRVVGMKQGSVVDYDIQEALSMTKQFPMDLYNVANDISF